MKSPMVIQRLADRELAFCSWANRACTYRLMRELFAAVSVLGNGRFWYGLMITLPFVYGRTGWYVAVEMAVTGLVGLLVYKLIKNSTHRLRPFMRDDHITAGASALDQYSFPSGHTLHAVSFTLVCLAHLPELAPLLLPLTVLIAISRVVLGLHFPSDVALGALIGAVLAWTVPPLLYLG